MHTILDTGVKTIKNVNKVLFGSNSIKQLREIISKIGNEELKKSDNLSIVVFIDIYFKNSSLLNYFDDYHIVFINSKVEPKTTVIDNMMTVLRKDLGRKPDIIIGFGGGSTLDTAKACSNLFNNEGDAADYQGWDKLRNKGVFKIGIPTISGTGSEATRTCVMTNTESGLKLGMNSDFTVFDFIILDPTLTETVNRNQYFYTGMDSYIHCMESLEGNYRNAIGDAYSREVLRLCNEIFNDEDMMTFENREKLMIASYLGGCSIAASYVGVVHPFSAGLSVVLGTHHCEANCIVMNAMEEFYPSYYNNFHKMAAKQGVSIKKGIAANLTQTQYNALYEATIIHEKPLFNALGENYKHILNKQKVTEIFKRM